MAATTIHATILEDGTISIRTGDIADTAHVSADSLLSEIEELLGGKTERRKLEHPFMKNKLVQRGLKIVKAG